jgi:hypothetical protein
MRVVSDTGLHSNGTRVSSIRQIKLYKEVFPSEMPPHLMQNCELVVVVEIDGTRSNEPHLGAAAGVADKSRTKCDNQSILRLAKPHDTRVHGRDGAGTACYKIDRYFGTGRQRLAAPMVYRRLLGTFLRRGRFLG